MARSSYRDEKVNKLITQMMWASLATAGFFWYRISQDKRRKALETQEAAKLAPHLGQGQQSYGPHPGYTEPALHPDMPAHQIPRHRPQGRGAPPGQIARVQHHYFGGYETD